MKQEKTKEMVLKTFENKIQQFYCILLQTQHTHFKKVKIELDIYVEIYEFYDVRYPDSYAML